MTQKFKHASDIYSLMAEMCTQSNHSQLLGDGGDLSLFKAMVTRRGIAVGDVRAPLVAAAAVTVAERWEALKALDIGVD